MTATVTIERYIGDTADPITDTLTNGGSSNFTGAGAPALKVRALSSSTVSTLTATWSSITTGAVSYQPATNDVVVTTAGVYRAWWYIASMPDGDPLSAPPFYIVVIDPTGATTGNPVDLCTVEDVKNAFEPAMTTSVRDVIIQSLVTAASIAINRACDREFTPQGTQTRLFKVPIDSRLVNFGPYDLVSASSITLNPEDSSSSQTLTPGDATPGIVLLPLQSILGTYKQMRVDWYANVFANSWILYGFSQVSITGSWGCFSTSGVPADIRQACVLTVRSWMRQNPAAYAFADVDREPGNIAPEAPATFAIPPGAWRLLRPYTPLLI